MDVGLNAAAHFLLNKSLSEFDVNELRSIATEHPYVSAFQFLLLKKLEKHTNEYETQYQKAILFYHDPPGFDHFINSEESNILLHELEAKVISINSEKENVETEIEESKEEAVLKIVPANPPDTELSFEPYHTVDYFASQGIKATLDEAPDDKFGKGLKSFTEWLKTMKRLPVPQSVSTLDPAIENKVQDLATHSVEDTEIVTESMAEVWLKQGNRERAREVYTKLSLLNPAKRAYFADKIQKINE
jgi:hypothetical protein